MFGAGRNPKRVAAVWGKDVGTQDPSMSPQAPAHCDSASLDYPAWSMGLGQKEQHLHSAFGNCRTNQSMLNLPKYICSEPL